MGAIAFISCVLLLSPVSVASQSAQPQSNAGGADKQAVRLQISRIIQDTIKAAHIKLADGTEAYVRAFPSSEAIARVKGFGDTGLAVLAEYLNSKEIPELRVVMRLLAGNDAEAAKDLMDDFGEKAMLPSVRSHALDFIAANNRPKDVALLKKIAASDADTQVRTAARNLTGDWRSRYGPPESERYVVSDTVVMTVFYSKEGGTCKAIIEPAKRQSAAKFREILEEVIPLEQRGKQLRSVGLSSSANRIESEEYERLVISLMRRDQEPDGGIDSATIYWRGVQCRLPEHQ